MNWLASRRRLANRNRPKFQRMLDHIREGDIIVFWKLDRLARSTRDLLETMETIREAGGRLQSISEPWLTQPLTRQK
jgi:DNA invertase Pin-like site-specific DNA recombinase